MSLFQSTSPILSAMEESARWQTEKRRTDSLHQFFTPRWASQEIVDLFYPDLSADDLIVEPSCGDGSFLQAIPDHVPAVGIEIDPIMADRARENTGRRVLTGDFRTIDLPDTIWKEVRRGHDPRNPNNATMQAHQACGYGQYAPIRSPQFGRSECATSTPENGMHLSGAAACADAKPTLIVGNPPFRVKLIGQFLERARQILPDNGRCGLLLPSYAIQTPSTVLGWSEHWSMDQRLIPRTLFPRAIRPLIFLMLTKDKRHEMAGGFALYHAAAEISRMRGQIKLLLVKGQPHKSVWRAVVDYALNALGGRATLDEIYSMVEDKRPTPNPWYKEKIRQTLQRHYHPIERGVWALAKAA